MGQNPNFKLAVSPSTTVLQTLLANPQLLFVDSTPGESATERDPRTGRRLVLYECLMMQGFPVYSGVYDNTKAVCSFAYKNPKRTRNSAMKQAGAQRTHAHVRHAHG
eukprot:990987-Alexandrium_andersonii.AAC.1